MAQRSTSAEKAAPLSIRLCTHSKWSLPVSIALAMCWVASAKESPPQGCIGGDMLPGWCLQNSSRVAKPNIARADRLQSTKPESSCSITASLVKS